MRWWGDDHVLARLDPSPSNYDAIADFAGAFFRTRDLLVKATRAVSVGDARRLLSGNRLIGMRVEEGELTQPTAECPSRTCAIASAVVLCHSMRSVRVFFSPRRTRKADMVGSAAPVM